MASKIEEEFRCPICLEVAKDAVETECCNHAYCEEHAKTIADGGSSCPTCRKTQFRYRPAMMARRVIGNLPAECPFCESTVQLGNLEDHKKICSKTPSTYRASQPAPNQYARPAPPYSITVYQYATELTTVYNVHTQYMYVCILCTRVRIFFINFVFSVFRVFDRKSSCLYFVFRISIVFVSCLKIFSCFLFFRKIYQFFLIFFLNL